MYSIQNFEADISVEEYLRDYVDVATFLEDCKACPNYNKIWACPPYDFNPEEYWNRYTQFHVIGKKIIFNTEILEKNYSKEEMRELLDSTLFKEKQKLAEELWKMEEKESGSKSLSAANCTLCGHGNCSRPQGKPCKHPEKMHYSIESLGGNVGKTCSKLMGVELEWLTEGKLPNYLMLVSGLLKK
jgi:predicted metal-binding protein